MNAKRIRQIINEAINHVLGTKKKLTDDIDVSSISIDDLKRGYKDFRLVPSSKMYGNVVYSPASVKEAVGDSYPPEIAITNILQKYNLPSSLAERREHYHNIYVYLIVAAIGINDKLVEDDMEKLGYFLSVRGDAVNVSGMDYQVLQFEPMCQLQEDITEELKSQCNILYHWTPSANVPAIMENGLTPMHTNKVFNYPPRIYLITCDVSEKDMFALGHELSIKNGNDREYTLLAIDLRGIDDNIRFFKDPNSAMGVYTEQAIPKGFIKIQQEITFPALI